jgi:hypothetical protein
MSYSAVGEREREREREGKMAAQNCFFQSIKISREASL